jgi:hypothetical protein
LLIEAVQVLGAEDCGLAGNGCVARPVNTSFSIRPDGERPEQLKPFDNPGEVLLRGASGHSRSQASAVRVSPPATLISASSFSRTA